MIIHELKSWPGSFEDLAEHRKTHEYRKDDRGFNQGDWLILREWLPTASDMTSKTGTYTGSVILVTVESITRGPDFDIPEGYCVMSVVTVMVHWIGEDGT